MEKSAKGWLLLFPHKQWQTFSIDLASYTEYVGLVAVPRGGTLCRRVKELHKETESFRRLWVPIPRAVLVGGTRNNFIFHSLAENAFHNFQSDLTVNSEGDWTGTVQGLNNFPRILVQTWIGYSLYSLYIHYTLIFRLSRGDTSLSFYKSFLFIFLVNKQTVSMVLFAA